MNRADSDVPQEPDDDLEGAVRHFEPDEPVEEDVGFAGEYEPYQGQDQDEPLRRELAQFAFVREEDDREVRLTFRDVPAHEIARAFRDSGALLISMTGERALSAAAMAAQAQPRQTGIELVPEETQIPTGRRKRGRRGRQAQTAGDLPGAPFRPNRHTGELTMRYFYSLGETVYTVNMNAPTGIVESIAHIYPAASLSERDLQARLAVLFRAVGG